MAKQNINRCSTSLVIKKCKSKLLIATRMVKIKKRKKDFPGAPVSRTCDFENRGYVVNPWSGHWDPMCRVAQPKCKNKIKRAKTEQVLVGVWRTRTLVLCW